MENDEEQVKAAAIALAKKAEQQGTSGHAAAYALASLRLAEAYAWLYRPAQPHGGSASE